MRSRSGDRPPTRGIQMKHWRALRPPPSGRHKSTTRQKKPYQLRQRPLPLHFWIPTQTAISVSGKISVNTFSYHVELLYNALLHSDISRCIMQTIQTSHRSSAPAMQKLRNQRRANGMRPIQIWVPDTSQPEFVSECQRQTRNIASNVTYEREIMDLSGSTADTQWWGGRSGAMWCPSQVGKVIMEAIHVLQSL